MKRWEEYPEVKDVLFAGKTLINGDALIVATHSTSTTSRTELSHP